MKVIIGESLGAYSSALSLTKGHYVSIDVEFNVLPISLLFRLFSLFYNDQYRLLSL